MAKEDCSEFLPIFEPMNGSLPRNFLWLCDLSTQHSMSRVQVERCMLCVSEFFGRGDGLMSGCRWMNSIGYLQTPWIPMDHHRWRPMGGRVRTMAKSDTLMLHSCSLPCRNKTKDTTLHHVWKHNQGCDSATLPQASNFPHQQTPTHHEKSKATCSHSWLF